MRNRTSLDALYEAHGPGAKRLAYLLVGDEDLAEDLVQEAFARILGTFGHVRGPRSFDAYLRQTIVNLARRHWRRRALERTFLSREARQRVSEVAAAPDTETREWMWSRLLSLPPRQRAALVLRFYEDLSEAEVAQELRCSVGAAKQLVSRGLHALRISADAEGDG